MTAIAKSFPTQVGPWLKARSSGTLARVARYTAVRLILQLLTVAGGVYLTVLIANMGGYVDEIRRGVIQENLGIVAQSNPAIQRMTREERDQWFAEQMAIQEKRLGMDQPFLVRSFLYLSNAMTLDFGMSDNMASDSGSRQVRLILLERLPSTLVLFATAQLTVFFSAISMALPLSRRYGSWLDKLIVMLTPASAVPGWFYGLFFILIFAGILKLLPFGGMVAAPPPENPVEYALSLGKHLILPVGAIATSAFALTTYTWRTFFLIYSHEDYVELAKAKGLPDREVHARYILRPTLPTILTNFCLTLIALWTGAIITETVFNWPGMGRTLFTAIGLYDTPVIIASTVIYAYLLAVTVFMLDLAYAFIDPRVKVGGGSKRA